MTAVIYARYSSDSQREASIEGQLRDCKDYAEKNGITVVGTYIDRAYSAKTDDRPDFQRMIKDSAKKIFDVVLVWKLDRFARNRFDAVNYKYQLEKNGVHLVSAMEPISQGPEGIMVESMLIGMAEYYSAELALKVARGERENALQCKYNGGVVPLGFTIGKEDRLYHIDPETAPIVQEIFTRYADGEPAEKIAASLNERGLRTRTGKPFVKNSFFQIFRNRRYIGEYRYKDIVTPGGIPAIVDEDLFNRVQQRFEQNKIAHGRPAKEDVSYLLTTKLFCGKCGTLMGGESGTSHMGNTYYYYKCGNAKRHGKAHCDLKAIRKEPLERFVVDTAIKVIFSDEIIERLIDLVMEAQQQENTRLPVLKEQLRDTEKRLANLLEAIEQGILTPTTKQRLDELETRKEALNTSILEEELKKPVLTAASLGIPTSNILIAENGSNVILSRDEIKLGEPVTAGAVMVDGLGVGDVGNVVLRDRKHLSEDGLVIIVATVDSKTGKVLAGPDLVSRGFVYVRENESLMDGAQSIVENALDRCVEEHVRDWNSVKTRVREALSSYIYRRTKRSPMILPILMEV